MSVSAFQTSPAVAIASGQTKSNAFGFKDYAQGGFIVPTGFTGVGITFEVSVDGSTFVPFHNSAGVLVALVVAPEQAYAFPLDLFPFPWVKIVSGSAEAADRTIQLALKY